jgi:hypothetical protein
LQDEQAPDYYQFKKDTAIDCNTEPTEITCNYVSENEELNKAQLSVFKDQVFKKKLLDNSSSTDSQGTLTVNNFNSSNEAISFNFEGTYGDETFILESGNYGVNTGNYGNTGLMISFMIFITLSLAGLFRPSASIAMGVLAIVMSVFIGALPLAQTSLTALVAVAAVLIWRMN